jgi:hypothetical protein
VSVARTSDSFSPPITCTCPVFTMYICFPTSPWKSSRTMHPKAGNFSYWYSCKLMVQNRRQSAWWHSTKWHFVYSTNSAMVSINSRGEFLPGYKTLCSNIFLTQQSQ